MSSHRTTLRWDAEALWRRLSPALPGLGIEVLARCESTNTVLLNRCRTAAGSRTSDGPTPRGRRSDDLLPCLLVAETQTHGRGRLGRDWLAVTGASLTFSLALPLAPRGPDGWSGLSLAVGSALADALDPAATGGDGATAPRVGLKWPNDLWLIDGPGRGRKLGGILIETVPVGDRRMLVVGVGLNVRPVQGDAAAGLEHGHASVSELDDTLGAPQVLAGVAPPLVQALQRFEAQGFAPFMADYARRDLLAGQPVVTRGAEPAQDGVCEGVQPDGALRLRRPDGTLALLVSGEVSVRLKPPASPRPAPSPQPC
jgi:BirA family transcriptional regulator, biotin operon repressor / biotin---[acetyl-CoA-carboxylase] ligase